MTTLEEIMDDIDMDNEEATMAKDEQQQSENDSNLEEDYVATDDKTPGEILDEFCTKLDEINTTIPDAVVGHYMKKAGFVVNDPKLTKIISIATQKFVSDIVNDVMQHHKLKANFHKTSAPAPVSGAPANAAGSAPSTSAASAAANKQQKPGAAAPALVTTLTLEDLSQVLSEYGINVKKPYYFM